MLHCSKEHQVQTSNCSKGDRVAPWHCYIAGFAAPPSSDPLPARNIFGVFSLWPDVRFKISVPWIPMAYGPNNAIGSTGSTGSSVERHTASAFAKLHAERERERERDADDRVATH